MLAALLPLIEAMSAEGAAGGTAAGLGGGVAEGGLLTRLLGVGGGNAAFGSEVELGGALRKISDLQASIQQSQEAMAQKRQRQEEIAARAREDERKYAFSDPGHQQQMADLVRQQQAHLEEIRQAQKERDALRSRAAVTTDPSAARAASFTQMAGAVGAIGAVSSFTSSRPQDPFRLMDLGNPLTLMRKLFNRGQAGVSAAGDAAANVGGFLAGPTNAGIIGDAVGTGRKLAGDVLGAHPAELVRDISQLPQKIKNWGEALVESQRSISRFNGVLALTFAEQERRGVIRAIQSGGRTGGATSELSGKLQDLYDQIQPIKDQVTIVSARALTVGVDYLSKILKALEAFQPLIDDAVRRIIGYSKEEYEQWKKDEAALQRAQQRANAGPIIKGLNDAIRRKDRLGVAKR